VKKPSVVVAINPAARRMNKEKADKLYRFFQENSKLVDFVVSKKAGDITTAAKRASGDSSVELFVVAGGDGTLNEAINGISCPGPKIGYVPGGTSNVIRFELGISGDIYRAAGTALWGKSKKIRPGVANGRKFMLMTGIGIDADIVHSVSGELKSYLGKAEYIRTGLKRLFHYSLPAVSVEVEGENVGDFFWAVISRSSYYAGKLRLVREATLDRDTLVAYLFREGGALPYLRYSLKTIFGVPFGKRDAVKVESDSFILKSTGPVPYQVDGDFVGHLPLDVCMSEDWIEINTPTG
jgi:YegS/Rv2252/BmrU family lipid kinase